MSNFKKALQALVVLAFLAAFYAMAIGDMFPNPDDFARKLKDVRQADATMDRALKANPNQFGPQPSKERTTFLWEGFEGGVIPPTGWTLDEYNPVETWEIDSYNPYEGWYNATCYYDASYTDYQYEYLVSPVMDFTAKQDLKLSFAWLMSYYWGVSPNDNYDLKVDITTDGSSWTTLWTEADEGEFINWTWYETVIDLSAYENETTVQIRLAYEGYDGAQGSFDAVMLNDDPLPVGRCCYGYDVDPQNPLCADNTQLECDALGGNWDGGLDCTTPCPAAGENDNCEGAIEMFHNDVIVGSTVGAQVDCPGVLDWNSVWYKFVNPYDCANVTFDYCDVPTVYNVECLGVVVYDECPPDCPNYILYTSNEWVSCPPAPSTQPITHFNMLPAGTYWYPVFIGDASCNPIEDDFSFRFLLEECPPAQEGDNCTMPIEVTFPADLDYTDVNTTCGRLDNYNATCLGYYDGGEDIIYEITVTEEVCVNIFVDPDDTYSGFGLDDACPPAASGCIAVATAGYSSAPYGVANITLAAGTYYLMIDTWPSPPCVSFTLTIEECGEIPDGISCEQPIHVKLPADLPYADLNATTCLMGNEYSTTCMGYYDGGEDVIYELEVTDACAVVITMDPKTSTWSGLGLDDACPFDGVTCLAVVTGSAAAPRVIETVLAPGSYWIMVDTWPSPNCIPVYDLTIDVGPSAAVTPTSFDFGTVNEGDQGSEVLQISNVGGGSLQYDIDVVYAPPRNIANAYMIALDQYKPGMTMDIRFMVQNASPDVEWIQQATVDFPTGVTVNGATNMVVVGGTRYLLYDGSTGDGAFVTWGYYNYIYSTEAAIATVSLTFDAGLSGDISIPWTLTGDGWGSPPHFVSGVLKLTTPDPYTSWLIPSPSSGAVPGGSTDMVDMNWDATGLANDTYEADIIVTHSGGKGQEIVPATITVTGGKAKSKMAPDPVFIYYKYAFTPMSLTLFVGNFNTGYGAADVASLEINGVAASIVGVTTHPSFVGDVVEATVAATPFLEGFGAPLDTSLAAISVAGTFSDMTAFEGEGRLNVIGKSSSSGGKRWIVPSDMVLLHGDVDLSGYIDIDDAVTTIEIIFVGGQVFGPLTIADVNCSHSVDIDDVVYLVQFIFNNGPFPCHD